MSVVAKALRCDTKKACTACKVCMLFIDYPYCTVGTVGTVGIPAETNPVTIFQTQLIGYYIEHTVNLDNTWVPYDDSSTVYITRVSRELLHQNLDGFYFYSYDIV